jgi:hypothetical protein
VPDRAFFVVINLVVDLLYYAVDRACASTDWLRQAESQGNAMNTPSEKLSAPVEKIRSYHAS